MESTAKRLQQGTGICKGCWWLEAKTNCLLYLMWMETLLSTQLTLMVYPKIYFGLDLRLTKEQIK